LQLEVTKIGRNRTRESFIPQKDCKYEIQDDPLGGTCSDILGTREGKRKSQKRMVVFHRIGGAEGGGQEFKTKGFFFLGYLLKKWNGICEKIGGI